MTNGNSEQAAENNVNMCQDRYVLDCVSVCLQTLSTKGKCETIIQKIIIIIITIIKNNIHNSNNND